MRQFPAPIHKVMAALTKLPGVGPKTALRYCFALLSLSEHERERMATAIIGLKNVSACQQCFTFSEQEICLICADEKRDNGQLCVVAQPRDISTIEATGAYSGKYFVLGGTLNPIEGKTPEILNMDELMQRLQSGPDIAEVILAFSPDVHGETTMMYLSRQIKQMDKKVTRLARGLPMGADLEYADEVTLSDAFMGRRTI